ncbi:hypothetical protein GCM10022253_18110 [Sphingomonas endophytica]
MRAAVRRRPQARRIVEVADHRVAIGGMVRPGAHQRARDVPTPARGTDDGAALNAVRKEDEDGT